MNQTSYFSELPAKVMDAKAQRLVEVLDSIIKLLRSDGETHWVSWLSQARARMSSSEVAGATHLLRAYGGMGSFNDVVIGQNLLSWKPPRKDEFDERNQELARLSEEAWVLANEIRKSHEFKDV